MDQIYNVDFAIHCSIDQNKIGNDHAPFQVQLCDIRMNTSISTMHDAVVVLSPNLCTAAWCLATMGGTDTGPVVVMYTPDVIQMQNIYVANSWIIAHNCITVACYSSLHNIQR